MNRNYFEQALDQLTPRQKSVLRLFLAGERDAAIAKELDCQPANIRRHLSNICKVFGLTNGEDEHYSYRNDLIDIFIDFQADWVSDELIAKQRLFQPEEPAIPRTSYGCWLKILHKPSAY